MKKWQKTLALCMAVMASASTLASCGGDQGIGTSTISIDPTKTQVLVGVFDGGLGRDWFEAVKKKYEAINPNVQIIPRYDKARYETTQMLANYGAYDEDLFLVDLVTVEYRDEGMYYDITDAVSTPLTEFGESKSILDKMTVDMQTAMKEEDGKYYALPYYEGFYSTYYDIRLFEDKAFYMDGNGGYSDGSVKSKGKDGVAGTYDDGLPATVEEFFTLCDHMLQKGVTPFTWAGTAGFYTTQMLENFWMSYEGYENTRLSYTLNSGDAEYTFLDGTSEKITRENAYKLKDGQAGKLAALEFAYSILNGYNGKNGGGKYHSGKVWATGQTHMAAQDEFLFSSALNQPIAFLVDGTWWEREAAESFASLYKRTKDKEDKYGNRRFGLMPMPTLHGENNEQGKETVISSIVDSRVFVNKNTDVAEEAISFFRYLHTNEAMSIMTSLSNTFRPFDYVVTETDKANMTPLCKQISEVFKSENSTAKLLPDMVLDPCFKDTGFFGYAKWSFGSNLGIYSYYPIDEMHSRNITAAEYLASMQIDQAKWQARITEWTSYQQQ